MFPIRFVRCPNDGLWVGRPLGGPAPSACPACGRALLFSSAPWKFDPYGEKARHVNEPAFRLARRAHDVLVIGGHLQVAYGAMLAEAASDACDVALTSRDRPARAIAPLLLDSARRVCDALHLPSSAIVDEAGRPLPLEARVRRAIDFAETETWAVDLSQTSETSRFSVTALFHAGVITAAARASASHAGDAGGRRELHDELREHVLGRLVTARGSRAVVHFLLEAGSWSRPEDDLLFRDLLREEGTDAHRAAVLCAIASQSNAENRHLFPFRAVPSLSPLGRQVLAGRIPSIADDTLALSLAIRLLAIPGAFRMGQRAAVLSELVVRTGKVYGGLASLPGSADLLAILPTSLAGEVVTLPDGEDPRKHVRAVRDGVVALSRLDGLYRRFVPPHAGVGLVDVGRFAAQVQAARTSLAYPADVALLEQSLQRIADRWRTALSPSPAAPKSALQSTVDARRNQNERRSVSAPAVRAPATSRRSPFPGRLVTAYIEALDLLPDYRRKTDAFEHLRPEIVERLTTAVERHHRSPEYMLYWSFGSFATEVATTMPPGSPSPASGLVRQYWLHEAWHSAHEARSAGLVHPQFRDDRSAAWLRHIHAQGRLGAVDWGIEDYFAYTGMPSGPRLPVARPLPGEPHIVVAAELASLLDSGAGEASRISRGLLAAATSWGSGTVAGALANRLAKLAADAGADHPSWHQQFTASMDQVGSQIMPYLVERAVCALASVPRAAPSWWNVPAADLGEMLAVIRRDPGIGRHWHGHVFLYSQGAWQPWISLLLVSRIAGMIRGSRLPPSHGAMERDLVAALRGAISFAATERSRDPFEWFVRARFVCREGELLHALGLIEPAEIEQRPTDVYCPKHVLDLVRADDRSSLIGTVLRTTANAALIWGTSILQTGRPVQRLGVWFLGPRTWMGRAHSLAEIIASPVIGRHDSASLWMTLEVLIWDSTRRGVVRTMPVPRDAKGGNDSSLPEELVAALEAAGPDAVGYMYSFAFHDAMRLEAHFLQLPEGR